MSSSGECVWFDVFTDNTEKAKAFYTELFNWKTQSMDTPAGPYTIFKVGEKSVAGLTKAPLPVLNNSWLAYVAVNNLDTSIEAIKKNGGKTLGQEIKMPGVGRWVIAQDPQGGVFCPFEGSKEASDCSGGAAFGGDGQVCWHELMSSDYKSALNFYAQIFGWKPGTAMDMGPMGTYQMYNTAGDKTLGGMMTNTPDMPQKTYWLEYIQVKNVDETVSRATRLGGKPTFPAMNVGNNSGRIAGLVDPNGCAFAVYCNV